MVWLVFLLVLIVLLVYAIGYRLPYRILIPYRKTSNLRPDDLGFAYETLQLTTSDGLELEAYYVPAPGATRNLILLHGNAGCKEGYLEYLLHLVPAGTNVLLPDQRGHGRSQGRFHTFGYHEWRDVEAADHFLQSENDLPTALFGHSAGGAVALSAAIRMPHFGAVVVQSSFANFAEITHAFGRRLTGLPLPEAFTRLILRRAAYLADFDPHAIVPEDLIRRVTVPTLVIHGEADERIPVDHGRRLFAASGSLHKQWYLVSGGGHDTVAEAGGERYFRTLTEFLGGELNKR